jgi:type IV secretory pathway VirB2 component (pilin)
MCICIIHGTIAMLGARYDFESSLFGVIAIIIVMVAFNHTVRAARELLQ